MTVRELMGRLVAWRRRAVMTDELTGELEAHIALLARDFVQEGMSPIEALAAARRQVGNVARLREESRDGRSGVRPGCAWRLGGAQ